MGKCNCGKFPKLGRFRHRVILQVDNGTQASDGQVVPSWANVTSLWASIEPVSGDETNIIPEQIQGYTLHKVTTRYYEGVTTKHRLLYGNRVLNIESVINLEERNRFLRFTCKEKI